MITSLKKSCRRPVAAALALVCGVALGAGAAQANQFQGGGILDNFVGCAASGWEGSIPVTARAFVNENGLQTLAIFAAGFAMHFRVNGEPDHQGWTPLMTTEIYASSNMHGWSEGRALRERPSEFDMNSELFNARFRIRNFAADFDCRADISVSMYRR